MRFTETLKYNIKRAIPMLAIAGAGLMASCEKDYIEQIQEQEYNEPMHDVELTFYENSTTGSHIDNISFKNIETFAQKPNVANIYLTVTDENDYTKMIPRPNEQSVKNIREYLTKCLEISPKVHGHGNFKLPIGAAAPEDSLWFVEQGWTINQHLQNQK